MMTGTLEPAAFIQFLL